MMLKTLFTHALAFALGAPVLLSSVPAGAQPSQVGQWTTLTQLPFFPVHDHLLPTGKVMIWPGDAGISGNDPRLWDPATQAVTTLPKPGYDLFCTGHAFLADGRLFVAGGHIQNGVGLSKASLYDPFANTWTATPDQMTRMQSVAHDMVDEWSRTKTPPRHTAWLHQKEFAPT